MDDRIHHASDDDEGQEDMEKEVFCYSICFCLSFSY